MNLKNTLINLKRIIMYRIKITLKITIRVHLRMRECFVIVIDWLFFRISYFACISLQTVSAP